ncbi:serine/threonine-protein kinase Nek7-like [Hyperolius riggenbachi]|uniref:serine/threonine-protein kinase Nek7-like n=1 Tax=Hyperolius riggenbachi TaxID=752182 RepID=UPI0035A2BF09
MKAIIHESIARIGLVEDGKPVFENKDEEKWKNQRRKSMAERISLFENSKPLNKNEDEESWQIQRKKILGAVKNKDQEMKQIQQKKLLEEMKAVLKGLNPNHENEPGGVQQAQKKGAVQEKDTLVKDFQQKAGIEDGKIQKDQKKNPVEKKNTLVKDFQHKAGIEDGEIQKDQKKNPVEIQVPVKKVENKDSGIEEDQKKIPVGVPLPQVQFVPEKEILIDERFKLGAGSFGTVYKGSYQGTPAAVKKIVCSNEDFNDIFLEIQVSISLNHTHIVKLMAAARTDTHILLANEYIHGDNLERILHSPNSIVQISEEDKLYVGLEMSLAIQYIHSKNIIHKDIKPANILVEARTKKTRLTDWGMANLRVAICTQMYQMIGPSGGTVAYMAPECVMDSQPATKMSDMWSVGATIAELFTKQKPWNTYTEIFHDMFLKLPPRPLASMNLKQLPIVKTCLSYDPKQRPTASDMVIAMKNMEGVDLTKRYGYTW